MLYSAVDWWNLHFLSCELLWKTTIFQRQNSRICYVFLIYCEEIGIVFLDFTIIRVFFSALFTKIWFFFPPKIVLQNLQISFCDQFLILEIHLLFCNHFIGFFFHDHFMKFTFLIAIDWLNLFLQSFVEAHNIFQRDWQILQYFFYNINSLFFPQSFHEMSNFFHNCLLKFFFSFTVYWQNLWPFVKDCVIF